MINSATASPIGDFVEAEKLGVAVIQRITLNIASLFVFTLRQAQGTEVAGGRATVDAGKQTHKSGISPFDRLRAKLLRQAQGTEVAGGRATVDAGKQTFQPATGRRDKRNPGNCIGKIGPDSL